jgi:hypothetical protein
MKILLLNHHIDAQHKISARLQAAGAVLLIPSHLDEAWKMIQLHGPSLDLAIVHREGTTDDYEGEKLIAQIKGDPTQSDLPVILTSSLWNEADFFQHQQGAMGVNAYLRWPYTDDELIETIETMFGNSIRFAGATMTTTHSRLINKPSTPPTPPEVPTSQSFVGLEIKLEEAPADSGDASDPNLKLEVPPPAPGAGDIGLSLEPPPGDMAQTSSMATAPLSEPGLPDLALTQNLENSMLEELEPYERLEIDQQLKLSSAAAPQLAAPEVEGGTMVLDPASVGLQPVEPQSSLEIALTTSESVGSSPINLEAPESASAPLAAAEPPTLNSRISAVGNDEPEEVFSSSSSNQGGSGADDELSSDLPYLFNKKSSSEGLSGVNSALVFSEPVGDAVIPGGAVQSPDTETLKKYLMLREQDVAILSNQLKAARDQVSQLEKRLREETGKAGELEHTVSEHQKRIEEFEKEKALALQGLQAEIDELRFQNKTKTDKARLLESKVTEATDEIERLKERVRTDIRKIRVREKELENKLEIVRKDSEALITARESKIMELKRKIDLLEFNIDLLQDQNAREKENSAQLRERLAKAAQVVRVAGGLLDSQGKAIIEESGSEKKTAREAS